MNAPFQSEASRRAVSLAEAGRVEEAYRTLETAIGGGDRHAAATLADWRIAGHIIRRDIGEARRLFGIAAELGLDSAAHVHIALLANGAGESGRDWRGALTRLEQFAQRNPAARRQLDLLARMDLTADGDPARLPSVEVLADRPRIEIRRGFMSAQECAYVAGQALPALQRAIVIHPNTGQAMYDPIRTALSTGFPFVLEDPVIHAINRRIMAATSTSYEQGEPIQVLSYQNGQEYKLHSDCLPPGQNQRVQTFLVTLSDGFEGGETSFPRIDLAIKARVGDAVHFHNTDEQGRPEALAWHAGVPVRSGRKLLLSKWIREAPLDIAGPPGRPF